MKPSMQSIRARGINEGHPPTTTEWKEWEAKLDKRPIRFVSAGVPKKGRVLKTWPEVTPEQASRCGQRFYAAMRRLCVIVSERGLLDDLVVAHAWAGCMTAMKHASQIEAVAASDSADESDPQRESGTTAVAAPPNNATSPEA